MNINLTGLGTFQVDSSRPVDSNRIYLGRAKAIKRLREEHDLDQLAAENVLGYLDEEREVTGALPTDRTVVLQRFRDELGDWRICLLTPFGARVHAPWALATWALAHALASLVLGMGVPVTAAYLITAVVAVPALTHLGVNEIAAHMIVYWLSQDSNITPPVCIAAFAGATIAMLLFAAATQGYWLVKSRIWESLAILLVAFMGLVWVNVSMTTMRQLYTPEHLLGRVTATARAGGDGAAIASPGAPASGSAAPVSARSRGSASSSRRRSGS